MKRMLMLVLAFVMLVGFGLQAEAADEVARGIAGSDISWHLDSDGMLRFVGSGDMYDFESWDDPFDPVPWSIYMNKITSVTMDDRITSLSDHAFESFRQLKSVTLSKNLTRIGESAFAYCSALETMALPDSIREIRASAFFQCAGLNLDGLPQSLTTLGENAFYGCAALTKAEIPEGVTELGTCVFKFCAGLEEISLPESLTAIGYECFYGCTSLKKLDIPENVTEIGRDILMDSGVTRVRFHGPVPLDPDWDALSGVTAQVGYPAGDNTWTEEVRARFSGDLTWVAEELEAHNWIPGTCTQPMTCADCGKTVGQAPGHSISEWFRVLDPSCTEPGLSQKKCWNCDYTEDMEIPAFGHFLVEDAKKPGCLNSGFYRYYCDLCEYVEQDVFYEALGHNYYIADMALSTCVKPGGELQICSRCDNENLIIYPLLDHDITEFYRFDNCEFGGEFVRLCRYCRYEEIEAVAPKEHNFVLESHTEPNCWNPGYTQYDCTDCKIGRTETADPLGHDYVVEVLKEATCLEAGLENRTCSRCGDFRQYGTSALGHDFVETVLVEPTCTRHGEGRWDCGRCDYSMESTINALGHQWAGNYCCRCGEVREGGFRDVEAGAYYAVPVSWAVEHKITTGTSATTFSPDDPCTRGQVVTFLWRAAGEPEPQSADNPFADVSEGDYFYKAVLWAVEMGITNGTSADTFSPGDPCTRAQVATFLWRSEGEPTAASQTHGFADIEKGYYYDAVLWAVEKNITNGTSANTFSPNGTCTRGQIVTFLYRCMK